jgi:hypothetical protein
MKAFLAGMLTATVAAVGFTLWQNVRDSEWIIMAIKNPGAMALNEIQADMNAGRYELAKGKIDILQKSWQKFSSGPDSCTGTGLSDIVKTLSALDDRQDGHSWRQQLDAENAKSGFVKDTNGALIYVGVTNAQTMNQGSAK